VKSERWALIANPVSGRGRARLLAPRLQRALTEAGVQATLAWTQRRRHGESLAQQALDQGATRLVVCGGDGTVHEVVNALMAWEQGPGEVALAIVPLGRCNDLGTALGLPKLPNPSAQALLQAKPRRIDVARVGGRYFTTVATLGFDSVVAEYVDRGGPPAFLRGTAAYVYGILVHLIRYRDVRVRLRGDFGEFHGPLFMAATANTATYGGLIKIAPSAVIDDGLLDLCLVPSVSRWEVLWVFPRVFSGSHVSHPAVSLKQTRRLEIQAEEPLWVWADGEPLAQTPVAIEVLPKVLSVLVP
jgi:YegS/Rv2252/BmrU family lipid kinase